MHDTLLAPSDPPRITIVTTCMGRLSFLRHTLPNWLKQTSFSIVVVDYSCPEGTSAWIAGQRFGSRVRTVRVDAERIDGRPVFHLSRARNLGAQTIREGFILFLDAETELSSGFQTWLLRHARRDAMCVPVPYKGPSDIWGTLCIHSDAFRAVGGYDEEFRGWGAEDLDMRLRLYFMGLVGERMPLNMLKAHPHSHELRSKFHPITDYLTSRRANQQHLEEKLLRTTGRSFTSWRRDPRAHKVLFSRPY